VRAPLQSRRNRFFGAISEFSDELVRLELAGRPHRWRFWR
jgi:hypothetical protein